MKIFRFLFFTSFIVTLSQCAPFKPLPAGVKGCDEIFGLYNNTCDSTDKRHSQNLWDKIVYKEKLDSTGLNVKLDTNHKGKLIIQLIKNDTVLNTAQIKGKFKEDNCYYTKRKFYVIPILPLLFAFSNRQNRIYKIGDFLVFEESYNEGGAVIIMAGGNSGNYYSRYKEKIND